MGLVSQEFFGVGKKQSGPTQVGPLKSDFRPIKLGQCSCPAIWVKLVLYQSF
jgi:hypothetical protein